MYTVRGQHRSYSRLGWGQLRGFQSADGIQLLSGYGYIITFGCNNVILHTRFCIYVKFRLHFTELPKGNTDLPTEVPRTHRPGAGLHHGGRHV